MLRIYYINIKKLIVVLIELLLLALVRFSWIEIAIF